MNVAHRSIATAVADYYGRVLEAHGPSPRGVDWSSRASQELRFRVLLQGIDWSPALSLLDYGCGYGALGAHIDRSGLACRYTGFDITPGMVIAGREANPDRPDRSFTSRADELEPADHVVASGIFNVKLDTPVAVWERYVEDTIVTLASLAGRTVSFNMLPPAAPPERGRRDLYYANPATVARRCEELLGGSARLRQDYGLWEFSITVTLGDV